MTDEKKKKKSKSGNDPQQKTSEDLLASLFNDLESTGKAEDLVLLINGKDKKPSKSTKYKIKDEHDDGKSSSKSIKHNIKEERDDKKSSSKEDVKSSRKSSPKKKKSKKSDKNEDNSAKKKSKKKKRSKSPSSSKHKASSTGDEKRKKSKHRSKSPMPVKRKASPSTTRKVSRSRSPVRRRRSISPSGNRSSLKRQRSTSPTTSRRDRKRDYTPPMYRSKWDNFKTKLDWGQKQSHSRDNAGYLPWERDRWSRERSRSWSPNRYKRRRQSTSPTPKRIDERRIDKKELLALARKNATRLAMEGRLPKGIELGATLKNKSVSELIQLCEEIQTRDLELAGPESVVINKDDEYESTDFSTVPVRSSSIRINLKDGSSKSTKSNLERMIEENALKTHFPVSSGDKHKGKTDQMTKEWMPVEIETPAVVTEEGVVSSLSKKTVKISTAYSAYAYNPADIRPKAKKEPELQEFAPFQLPLIPPAPDIPQFAMPPFPMFPMHGFNDMYTGYEAPEVISAAFFAPPAPPPAAFSSFDNPANEPSVPEPAPLTVVSNADLIAQAEERELEKQAEEALQAAIKNVKPAIESNGANEGGKGFDNSNGPNQGDPNACSTDVPMDVEGSTYEYEGTASPTPPPQEYVLPAGAILEKPVAPVSIGGLVSRRARLVQELQLDPDNHHKRLEIADIDIKLSIWAKVKNETTARFGAAVSMSCNVEPRPIMNSVWATKDTLRNAPEFRGGIGEHLLKRMGWAPGQGLGRHMDGSVEPLTLDVKADRKGLYSTKDKFPPRREHAAVLDGNKNPVSAVMEYCAKHSLPPPLFMPTEEGTSNNRRFGCKAILNGVEYDAATGATNKKAAKAQVALIICQSLGLA